jgi:hypothetical protein
LLTDKGKKGDKQEEGKGMKNKKMKEIIPLEYR